ncbi:MAG TPA: hypothetical protein DIC60_05735 [Lachnospiraceae bacterium]|nr:hypothetical protein [Lachnospiraceae bacterium]
MNFLFTKKSNICCLKNLIAILILCAVMLIGCGKEKPTPLEQIYTTAHQQVLNSLIAPATAEFPEFQESFVKYNTSVLEDLGEGMPLEYRVYDVVSYVDSMNSFGAMLRTNYYVQVYYYVDKYPSPKFGDQGIKKGIENHYYSYLISID